MMPSGQKARLSSQPQSNCDSNGRRHRIIEFQCPFPSSLEAAGFDQQAQTLGSEVCQ